MLDASNKVIARSAVDQVGDVRLAVAPFLKRGWPVSYFVGMSQSERLDREPGQSAYVLRRAHR